KPAMQMSGVAVERCAHGDHVRHGGQDRVVTTQNQVCDHAAGAVPDESEARQRVGTTFLHDTVLKERQELADEEFRRVLHPPPPVPGEDEGIGVLALAPADESVMWR